MPIADPAIGRPILASGSVDQSVVELTTRLNELGYEVPISDVVTPDVLVAVNSWRRENKIEDDPDSLGVLLRPDDVPAHVGPNTWRALFAGQTDTATAPAEDARVDELQAKVDKLEAQVQKLTSDAPAPAEQPPAPAEQPETTPGS